MYVSSVCTQAWLPVIEEDIMFRSIVSMLLFVAAISPIYAQQTEVTILSNGQITSPENIYTPPQKKIVEKNPWIAFLLSTAIPGAGQY